MFEYIPFQEFVKKYPRGPAIKEGSYGTIFGSETYIIKKQKFGSDFIKEICFMSQLRHPNICPILAVSFNSWNGQTWGYMALPRGEDLDPAFLAGKISLEQIVTDMLSGLSQINSNGFAHADIKINNFIFHEGRVKFIDFGFSRMTEYYADDDYFTDIAYADYYRDLEFNCEVQNSVKIELYPVAMSIYYLFAKYSEYDEFVKFTVDKLSSLGISESVIDLMMLCTQPLSSRPSLKQLLNHSCVISDRFNPPVLLTTSDFCFGNIKIDTDQIWMLFSRFSELNNQVDVKPRIYFMCCDIFSNYFARCGVATNKYELVGIAAYLLASYMLDEYCDIDHVYQWSTHEPLELCNMIFSIYNELGGFLIHRTMYDMLQTSHDLNYMPGLVISPSYVASKGYLLEKTGTPIDRSKPQDMCREIIEPIKPHEMKLFSECVFTMLPNLDP